MSMKKIGKRKTVYLQNFRVLEFEEFKLNLSNFVSLNNHNIFHKDYEFASLVFCKVI